MTKRGEASLDPELQSMQSNNKGWDYCGNAQGSVDEADQIIVACDVTVEANDKQPAAPMAQWTVAHLEPAGSERPTDAAGVVQKIPGTYDSGYDSEAAAKAVAQRRFEPSRPRAVRDTMSWRLRRRAPTTAKARRESTRTPRGEPLYARRKVIVEPVFGQSKAGRGFRRFLLRGLAKIRGSGVWCV